MKFTPRTEEYFTNQNRFKVYLNYLKSFSNHIAQDHFIERKHLEAVANSNIFKSIRTRNNTENEKIKQLLRNAWFTEIQLNFSKNHPEFISYSNHWVVVQVYYTAYLALRALFIAMNKSTRNGHDPTLNEISREIHVHPELFPSPWNITCIGDPKDKTQLIFNNFPTGIQPKSIQILASNNDFLDYWPVFLKTTRQKQLEEKRKKHPDYSKKKRLLKIERLSLLNKMLPTTIFDCLYRLRIRANYHDVEPFLTSIENQNWATKFNYSIRNICEQTLQIIEFLIARYLGKKYFETIINDFFKNDAHVNYTTLKDRWAALSALL